MQNDNILDMKQAGKYIGRSYRWMQRHYVGLIKSGVKVYRIPKDSLKGHILFNRKSLDDYLEKCVIKADFNIL